MTTVYEQVLANAKARTAGTQQTDAFASSRIFRENDKRTSQYSDDNHQTPVDPDAMFSGKVQDSLATRSTEHEAFKVAGGLSAHEEQPPIISVPNKYAGKKYCRNCKTWKLKTEFSPLATTIDGKHTYCRDCRAAKKRASYQPTMRWKRG